MLEQSGRRQVAKPSDVVQILYTSAPPIAMAIVALFEIIPRISPQGFRTEEFALVIPFIQLAVVVFLCVMGLVTLSTD